MAKAAGAKEAKVEVEATEAAVVARAAEAS